MRLTIFLLVLLLIPLMQAKPTISNISILPSNNLWVDQPATFSFICNEDNQKIQKHEVSVEVKTTNPITIPSSNFDIIQTGNNIYSTDFNFYSYNRTGQYNATIYCESDNFTDSYNYASFLFNVLDLTGSIEKFSSDSIYSGDMIEADIKVKKLVDNIIELDGKSEINFTTFIDQNQVPITAKYYDSTNKFWIIKTNVSAPDGKHVFKIKINFNGKTFELNKNIEIKPTISFDLISIDKTEIFSDNNITLRILARERGSNIPIDSSCLSVKINDQTFPLNSITTTDYTYVSIVLPSLTPKEYDLVTSFNYKGFISSESVKITYPLQLSGKIVDNNGDGVDAQLKFIKNGVDYKTFTTNSTGDYYGLVAPGEYDVEMTFSWAKVLLNDTDIRQFNDVFRFNKPKNTILDGIGNGGIYAFEMPENFTDLTLTMRYDDKKITDENNIIVYQCQNWNMGKEVCNNGWSEIEYELNANSNQVKVQPDFMSAFVIGYKKQLNVNFITDKSEYFLREPIKISGGVQDDENQPVPNANINVEISNTNLKYSTTTDNNGVFTLEFLSPDSDGRFGINAIATKSPYLDGNKTNFIKNIRSKKISVEMDDALKIMQGENTTFWISIINNGQTTFFNLNITLNGLPNEYFVIPTTSMVDLKPSEEKKIGIELIVPEKASVSSHTGRFTLSYGDGEKIEKQFLVTILEKNIVIPVNNTTVSHNFEMPNLSLPTANLTLPVTTSNAVVLISFAIIVFFAVYFLKGKNKGKNKERDDVKNFLLGINAEIKKNNINK